MKNRATRTDSFIFYALTTTSFLESAVPAYVENLCLLYMGDTRFIEWLNSIWVNEESEHGALAKTYVEELWPEFNWGHAYKAYYSSIPRDTSIHLRQSKALEALSRCVTETEATMIYRCLGAYTNDLELKNLMDRLSKDEVSHYKMFRDIFNEYQNIEKNGLVSIGKTILGRSELVKARDLAMAFAPINAHWITEPPFSQMNFQQFIAKAGRVMARYFPTGAAERMLFKPMEGTGLLEKPAKWLLRKLIMRKYPNFIDNTEFEATA